MTLKSLKVTNNFKVIIKHPKVDIPLMAKNPNSAYYKNLGVSYPNAKDRREADRLGKPVGGDIKIHGLPNQMPFIGKCHRLIDWTAGCMAFTNDEIDELYNAVPIGTPILILP
jgi:murein L,D-transpeptidase YafK